MPDSTAPTDTASPPSDHPDAVRDAPWAAPAEALLDALDTTRDGLSPDEAAQRLQAHGPNTLREVEPISLWTLLVNQLKSLIVLLLAAAGAVSLAFGDLIEAAAIGIVLLLNTAIGFFMEWRAVRSMEALREIGHVPATVRRDGAARQVDAAHLVPGDIVLLEEGDIITADLRLLSTSKLQIDESALTGESVPVEKDEAPVDADRSLADRQSMVYKGTAVTRGSGVGVVVATGMETELGTISALVEAAEEDTTPIEKRLTELAHSLVVVVLGLAAAVSAAGFMAGRELRLMLETGIALAVAAIPEGLPIVATIALARGLRRMAQRNALVRRLSSVETLGATSIICTDKTGTLTENRMTVARLLLPADSPPTEVEWTADAPANDTPLTLAAWVAALCNGATLNADSDAEAVGDPMEIALLRFADEAGHAPSALTDRFPEIDRDSFDRDTKMMASLRRTDHGTLVAVKGAPEAVLDACTAEAHPRDDPWAGLQSGAAPLDADRRAAWVQHNETLAADGLRVLGLAARLDDNADVDQPYTDLVFLGLIGLVDPPRADVRPAIQACQDAGIRVVMVTGDQPATARYIAHAVGLTTAPDAPVIHGSEFDALLEGHSDRLAEAPLFARVSPHQKLDLIDLHQEAGHIVAMTGDGVNDAPALKSADIGIAMGQRGTQVAQDAADVVLKDDAFSTIVAAVEEGRAIFTNIRAFVRYLLSCNVGEVLAVSIAALGGLTLPLLPLQILFLNLVTDVFPALALGMAEAETDVMAHGPRKAKEPVLHRRHWWSISLYGAIFSAVVIAALLTSRSVLGYAPSEAITISFLTLAFAQLWHVFNMRSAQSHPIRNVVVGNPYVWGAVALCSGLLLIAVYVPAVASVLSLTPPDRAGWLLVMGASLVPLLLGQIGLSLRARYG